MVERRSQPEWIRADGRVVIDFISPFVKGSLENEYLLAFFRVF